MSFRLPQITSGTLANTVASSGAKRMASTHTPLFGIERVPGTVGTVGQLPTRRPVGGLRGGLLGFFLGFSIASTYASYYLLQEYKLASSVLQGSVEDLAESTAQMSTHLRRIEAVEKDLRRLEHSVAAKEDITKLRGEMKKIYDGLHVEVLDLRAHVWGVEQDLNKTAANNSIRI